MKGVGKFFLLVIVFTILSAYLVNAIPKQDLQLKIDDTAVIENFGDMTLSVGIHNIIDNKVLVNVTSIEDDFYQNRIVELDLYEAEYFGKNSKVGIFVKKINREDVMLVVWNNFEAFTDYDQVNQVPDERSLCIEEYSGFEFLSEINDCAFTSTIDCNNPYEYYDLKSCRADNEVTEEQLCTNAGQNMCSFLTNDNGVIQRDLFCDTCDTCQNSLEQCADAATCTVQGGSWCEVEYESNNQINSIGLCGNDCTCSPSNLEYCLTENSCTSNGGQLVADESIFGVTCRATCSVDSLNQCSELTCGQQGLNWCGTYCSTDACPVCGFDNPELCENEPSCLQTGNTWCSSNIQIEGLVVESNYCAESCNTCSAENPQYCDTENECQINNNNWCSEILIDLSGGEYTDSYCSNSLCPVCDEENPWNCKSETTCESVSGLEWCTDEVGLNGVCSDTCTSCSPDHPELCISQNTCQISGNNWCPGNFCTDLACPSCSADNLWLCDQSTCDATNGLEWCDVQYYEGNLLKTDQFCDQSCPSCTAGVLY